MGQHRRTPLLLGAGIAVCALVVSTWGFAARDLAGDELNMLHGTPAQILAWSLDPRGGFVGHLPLSFWTRWLSLAVFSEGPAWAWRVHAVGFTVLTATLTATTARRHFGPAAGVVAGLLFCADPIIAFHAQEAGNYAASALTGALIARGLLDLHMGSRRGAAWLGAGLLMGACNDFYSVLLAGPALVVSAWLARDPSRRKAIAAAWLVPLVAALPFVLLFAARLLESTEGAVLDVHADPLPPRPLPTVVDAPWRVARRFFGAHLHGYAGGRNDALWLGLPPVLLGVLALVLTLRGCAWPSAVLVLGALVLHGVLGIGLEVIGERVLPFEPRSLLGLTPAACIAVASLAADRRSMAIPVVWFAATSLSTLEARLDPADLRDRALAHARTHLSDRSLVVVEDRTRTRAPDAGSCIPADADGAVVVSNHSSGPFPGCEGTVELPAVHRTFFDAPVHEGSAASFLPRRVVTVYGGAVEPEPLQLERAPFDGLSGVTWTHTDARGATLSRADTPTGFIPGSETTRIAATPTAPPWLPDHPLLLAFRNQVHAWELDPLDRQPTLRAAPFTAPWLTSLRRVLPVLGVLLGLLAVRRRP